MCGIGGFQLIRPSDLNLEQMLGVIQKVQHHRGPDGRGLWVDQFKKVGLCHNRLSIVDLTHLGAQPMRTRDSRYTITFNGEIYNWLDLRSQLEAKGVFFQSRSDTEVLLNGYKYWGVDVLQKLRGMFAFAIWDDAEQVLFCGRDQLGKKPFIYGESNKGFFFASEIPALKAINKLADLNLTHNDSALAGMLLHNLRHIPEPLTAYVGLCKLRPGHAVLVRDGKIVRHWRYWVPYRRPIRHASELLGILDEAVGYRAIADVPVAALLSGGIDSTTIVKLMQQKSEEPIRTFCFGTDENDEDILRARLVAKQLGTQHKEFYFDAARQYEIFKQTLRTYGEPIMLLPLVHAYELFEAIHDDGIKVVMNGNGADELFFGYTGHLKTARISRWFNTCSWVANLMPKLSHPALSVLQASRGNRKATFYRGKEEKCWPNYLKTETMKNLENVVTKEMAYWGSILPNQDFIDESNYLSLLIENSHSITIAGDLPAMMTSVEVRSPFLDQEIVAAAMGIHFSEKIKGPSDGSQLKNILRKAVHGLVPEVVLQAPKRGFGAVVQERDLLLGGWRKHADEIFQNYPESNLFDREKIEKQWECAINGKNVRWNELAKLFAIGTWMNQQ